MLAEEWDDIGALFKLDNDFVALSAYQAQVATREGQSSRASASRHANATRVER